MVAAVAEEERWTRNDRGWRPKLTTEGRRGEKKKKGPRVELKKRTD